MKYTILTLFPDLIRPWTQESILEKAIGKGLVEVDIRDIRAYAENKHHTVDDTPYGGGAGMVMRVDVAVRALEAAGPADGLGQPSRGATSRISVSPKLSIARAALPMFSPSCGRTSTITGWRFSCSCAVTGCRPRGRCWRTPRSRELR